MGRGVRTDVLTIGKSRWGGGEERGKKGSPLNRHVYFSGVQSLARMADRQWGGEGEKGRIRGYDENPSETVFCVTTAVADVESGQ